jgi:tyrosinase
MSIRIVINHSENPRADYITWSPSPCSINVTDGVARTVIIKNKNPNSGGGQMVFMNTPVGPVSDQLTLSLPANGNAVEIFIAGKFDQTTAQGTPFASNRDKDAVIALLDAATGSLVGEKALMVRVRKNANKLTPWERDNFLNVMVTFNNSNKFAVFQQRHTELGDREVHGRSSFLAWHRAFLLDLERHLQELEPSVCLPYWKFDEKAENVFTKSFMGEGGDSGSVLFDNINPLRSWKMSLTGFAKLGIERGNMALDFDRDPIIPRLRWNPKERGAYHVSGTDEKLLDPKIKEFSIFRRIEGQPHGAAHVSFNGPLNDPNTAPADPLFFMLHANVDRIWAKWQWIIEGQRYNPNDKNTYHYQGVGTGVGIKPPSRDGGIGDFTEDTMWPWNKDTKSPRPNQAPGELFPKIIISPEPGEAPRVKHMMDYQGQFNLKNNLCFAYDDVPYNFPNPIV